jgi:1,2-diacylglycerol 3-beta-galactosyltransferase
VPTIQVVFFDAGGGHRSAAMALAEAVRIEKRPWKVELINLQQILGHLDFVRKATGVYSQDVYNWSLRRGWTQAPSRVLPAMHGIIRLLHPRMVRELCDFWSVHRPDLVVSVIPHFNRALYESVSIALPGTPLVTVLTDIADHPPHFWIERQNQHFICGSDRAVTQALGIGVPPDHVWRVSGMPIHPRFYDPIHAERGAERVRYGLEPDVPTGLVLFGGYGSSVMLDIMERLSRVELPVQLILLCGRNKELAAALAKSPSSIRRVIRTFVDDVTGYMHLSDFFIGKPGPGCVSEALAMKLPVIVERNYRTMVQERYNCDWLEEQGAGIVVPSFAKIAPAVAKLLDPLIYQGFRERIVMLNNRAVFEITGIVEKILSSPRVLHYDLPLNKKTNSMIRMATTITSSTKVRAWWNSSTID